MVNSYSRLIVILVLLILTLYKLDAQEQIGTLAPVQTVKGRIVDVKTQQPVPGATIIVVGTKLGAYTASDGSFRIKLVPVGRQIIRISSIGYEHYQQNVVISSGRELQLNVELQESLIQTDTISVAANSGKLAPINEAAQVSSTVFSMDDVEKFAGSRMDPARMAQNFAGVLGANDQRNDIIIRGGSPTELLWRLDGLDIPNPNHFATQGSTGGPISAINSTILSNSDFLTGAFPAEYGGKLSGVFDLKTRKGNMDKYEFLGQFGFNGFEFGGEGPLPGVKGSFIANYRYSFLDLLDKMGFDFGGSGIPRYQDATVKIDIKAGSDDQISLTALGGLADIYQKESAEEDVETGDEDEKTGTDIASIGVNWQHLFSDKFYGRLVAGTVYGRFRSDIDSITTDSNHKILNLFKWYTGNSTEGYHTARYNLNYSPGKRHFITFGTEARLNYYSLNNERFTTNRDDSVREVTKASGQSIQLMNYINWNWRITENLTSNAGIHSQYHEINNKTTIEPRISLQFRPFPQHSFSLGYGINRQSLPLLVYFANKENRNLDLMQSIHYVAGYTWQMSDNALMKIEGYYKDISKVPIEANKATSWSFLNYGASFNAVDGDGKSLISSGKGRTYGAEFSYIKNFSDHYYVTSTASYVRQEYCGSDGIWRFGLFDNIYIINLLSGYEWIINPVFTIEFAGKFTIAGGAPYTPIDIQKSEERRHTYFLESMAYSERNPPYSRFDLRIDFRRNYNSFALSGYVSSENILNRDNIYRYKYNLNEHKIESVSQLGFFFVGGIRIEF